MTKASGAKRKRKSKGLFKSQVESMYMDLHKNANGMSAKKLELIHYILVKDLGLKTGVKMEVDVKDKVLTLTFKEEIVVEPGFFNGLLAYMELSGWSIKVIEVN